jgi:hypothetical protein
MAWKHKPPTPPLEPVHVWLTRCAIWIALAIAFGAFWMWMIFGVISPALSKASFDAEWACEIGANCN